LLSTDAYIIDRGSLGGTPTIDINEEEALKRENLELLGQGHFFWLKAANQKGMKPMDALMAATRNIAKAYKVDKDLGTLEKGKIADLLILDKNPLKSPENYRQIHLVMKEGQVVNREALPINSVLTMTNQNE
jgi:adenine deaminase